MPKPALSLTYALAMSIGQDAATKQMRAAGRMRWNAEDWNLAAKVTEEAMRLAGVNPTDQPAQRSTK